MVSIHYGWEDQPNTRGTFDIIWGCLFTTFLCSWSALCINVRAPHEGYWTVVKRKWLWMMLVIFGPETLLTLAIGQYCSAKQSVADFAEAGHLDWSIEHAFFAEMGGFALNAPATPDLGSMPAQILRFPVTARQILYLVKHEYMEFPVIEKDIIMDKDKGGGFGRILTLLQTLWFAVQCASRAIQHLSITTLELSTAATVVCTIPVFYCWAHKPLDIEVPITLTTRTPISKILVEAKEEAATRPYSRTPLDFIPEGDFNMKDYWAVAGELFEKWGIDGNRTRPVKRQRMGDFPPLTGAARLMLVFLQFSFAAIHTAAWNIHFPSPVEQLLWRICCGIMCFCPLWYWATDTAMDDVKIQQKKYQSTLTPEMRAGTVPFDDKRAKVTTWNIYPWSLKKMTLIEPHSSSGRTWIGDASLRMRSYPGAKSQKILLPLGFGLYLMVRIYLIAEVFAGLRAVPEDVFETVQWSNFIPHF